MTGGKELLVILVIDFYANNDDNDDDDDEINDDNDDDNDEEPRIGIHARNDENNVACCWRVEHIHMQSDLFLCLSFCLSLCYTLKRARDLSLILSLSRWLGLSLSWFPWFCLANAQALYVSLSYYYS